MGDSTTAGTPAFKSPREAPPDGSGDETSQYAYWLMKAHPELGGHQPGRQRAAQRRHRGAFRGGRHREEAGGGRDHRGGERRLSGTPGAAREGSARGDVHSAPTQAGIRVVAGTIIPYNTATADQNARMHDINDWIRAQARADAGVTFVDTRAAVAAPGDPDKLASSPDGLHPDAAGYRKMADAIAPAIEDWSSAEAAPEGNHEPRRQGRRIVRLSGFGRTRAAAASTAD